MKLIERILDIRLPIGQSAFLWGPRKTGHEVDFILGSAEVAIEVKGTDRVDNKDIRSIKLFSNDFSPKKSIIVCNERVERKIDSILIMPFRKFLSDLWDGEII